MSSAVAGIDPHQDNFTVGIIDSNGVEITHQAFVNSSAGYCEAIDLIAAHGVEVVGIEGSASWGAHVAIAVVAAGVDAREVPPQRSSSQRRSRRLAKTDAVDAVAIARALLAEPSLGPAQALECYDGLVAKIEAVLEHRRTLVNLRTLALHHIGDQIAKLPTPVRDQIGSHGKVESRLRRLEQIDLTAVDTPAGEYRLARLAEFLAQDRRWRREIKDLERVLAGLLDEHGTTLRDEEGVGVVVAATLLAEVGDPTRFVSEAKFAKWCGTGAIALSSGEGDGSPRRHRLDFGGNRRVNSMIYMASVTQHRYTPAAQEFLARKLTEGKTRREARRAHKRHLANRIIRRMWRDEQHRQVRLATSG
jgi:transposase